MAINPETRNVFQLGIGFLVILFAFNSQAFIEQTVVKGFAQEGRVDGNAGYVSLAIVYVAATIAQPFSASIVGFLRYRWSMVIGGSMYAIFQASFLYFTDVFLFVSSALVGVGAAIIWTAQAKYLAMNSNSKNASRHSNLFWALCQLSLTGGGLFLFLILRDLDANAHIVEDHVRILYSVFAAATIIGVIVLGSLPAPPNEDTKNVSKVTEQQKTQKEILLSMISLCKSRYIHYLVPVWIFMGIETSFWSGIYPTCLSFTSQLGPSTTSYVAFNAIMVGASQAIAGLLFGVLASKFQRLKRIHVIMCGVCLQLLSFAGIWLNLPQEASLEHTQEAGLLGTPNLLVALICGFLLGFGDSCWKTQMLALIISRYNKETAEVCAVYKFVQMLAMGVTFLYGTKLDLRCHIVILMLTALFAVAGFIMADRQSECGEVKYETETLIERTLANKKVEETEKTLILVDDEVKEI